MDRYGLLCDLRSLLLSFLLFFIVSDFTLPVLSFCSSNSRICHFLTFTVYNNVIIYIPLLQAKGSTNQQGFGVKTMTISTRSCKIHRRLAAGQAAGGSAFHTRIG